MAVHRRLRVWDAVCRHIDGMAIGSTMAVLSQHGVLDMLASADRTEFGKLCAATGANPGFLRVAIRLLADQGWVTCSQPRRVNRAVEHVESRSYRINPASQAVQLRTRHVGEGKQAGNGAADGDGHGASLAPLTCPSGVVGAIDTLAGREQRDAGGAGELMIAPTAGGRVVFAGMADAYARAMPLLGVAARVASGEAGADVLAPFLELARDEWGLAALVGPDSAGESYESGRAHSRGPTEMVDVRRQVLTHLNGHLIAPVMVAQTRGTPAPPDVLAVQGWHGTPEGKIAATMARQYRYPIVYLPLLRSVPELIFGDPSVPSTGAAVRTGARPTARPVPGTTHESPRKAGSPPPADEAETHLDRELDLRFSGDVFVAMCRTPFLQTARPVFDREPVAAQPALVVDTGCGDGALLESLYTEVRTRTARGRRLAEYPLVMVGVDPSPVARDMTAARLANAGIPHLVMAGDIADPDGLARELAAAGHDATNALHVCKSAIHDRAVREVRDRGQLPPGSGGVRGDGFPPGSVNVHDPRRSGADAGPPTTMTAFARPDGAAIDPADLAADLAGLFRAWRPLAGRHGWIVIEAHSAPASTVASLIGRTVATALDATHGYSCQYPVEPEVFRWAARTAGFISRAHHEPGASALGHTQLTIDHLVPIPGAGG